MSVLRRFWTAAAIAPHQDGWAVTLDGKVARTPAKGALATRHKRLAEAVALEWAGAGEAIDPRAMPLTGFLNAVIDRVRPNQTALAADVAKFGGAELLCYRAERPPELAARQAAGWDPVLDWVVKRFDARLICGVGVTPIPQSSETLKQLAKAVHGLDAYRFTAALKLSGIYKSLALTLAVVEAERDALAAHDLSRIDERFQAERWGEDAEAARRVAHEREELVSVASFLAALD